MGSGFAGEEQVGKLFRAPFLTFTFGNVTVLESLPRVHSVTPGPALVVVRVAAVVLLQALCGELVRVVAEEDRKGVRVMPREPACSGQACPQQGPERLCPTALWPAAAAPVRLHFSVDAVSGTARLLLSSPH